MELKKIVIDGFTSIGNFYDDTDFKKMKDIYIKWKNLNEQLVILGGRSLNVPELLSEGLLCYALKYYRTNGKNSHGYDAYDLNTNKGIQIKSSSIEDDCSSFGPKTKWDKIYFLKFFPQSHNGLVEIYDISDYKLDDLLLNVEKNETFKDQQEQGRRPRFSINMKIIKKNNLKPIKILELL
ncbi:MAG: Bsp6I family type II restriction endonuclease [Erysipelotrichales bacterium]|nr:Bsp6I family type II restriction endonuclease [Erysipelotrichales bacterium]